MNLMCCRLFLFTAIVTAHAALIDICVKTKENGVESIVSGATVQCWDEDVVVADDYMAAGTTDSAGCVTMSYSNKNGPWYKPNNYWDLPFHTNPDIYCIITKTGRYPLFTDTKVDWNQDNTAAFGSVTVYPDRSGPGTANGCGPASKWDGITNKVVDFLTGFEQMCNNHDHCYGTCSEKKADCDSEFLNMMYSKCNDDWDFSDKKKLCKNVANSMYVLVRDFGSTPYNNARKNNGCP